MTFKCLEDSALDLVLLLAQELLGGRLEELRVLHDFNLSNAGHSQGYTLGCLNGLADWVEGHHLENNQFKELVKTRYDN